MAGEGVGGRKGQGGGRSQTPGRRKKVRQFLSMFRTQGVRSHARLLLPAAGTSSRPGSSAAERRTGGRQAGLHLPRPAWPDQGSGARILSQRQAVARASPCSESRLQAVFRIFARSSAFRRRGGDVAAPPPPTNTTEEGKAKNRRVELADMAGGKAR